MTTAEERIVPTRWRPLMALGVLAVTAVLAAALLVNMLSGTGALVEQIFMGVLAAIFANPFSPASGRCPQWTLWRLPKTLRGMGIKIDDVVSAVTHATTAASRPRPRLAWKYICATPGLPRTARVCVEIGRWFG